MNSEKKATKLLKENLYKQCENFVNKRLQNVEAIISSNKKALQSETKSSAGDKHETGRAMLQLEMEKAGQQLFGIKEMQEILANLLQVQTKSLKEQKNSSLKTHKKAHLGSIIYTEKATYFLAISCGQITIENQNYFAISVSSPIGSLLLGKEENDTVFFNGKAIKIIEIA